jgi:hypothetical protein
MSDEIKVNLEMFAIVGYGGCRYSSGRNIKGSIPPTIYEWRKFKADLTNDLGP